MSKRRTFGMGMSGVRVRPSVIVVAGTLNEAQGFARSLPVRHTEIMTDWRAVSQNGLHDLRAGTTVHVLPSAFHGTDDLHDVVLEAAIEHLRATGVAVETSRRVEVARPRRGGSTRDRQPSKEEP